MDSIKPSKLLYAFSGLIFIVGIISFVVVLVTGIISSMNCINNRVVVPGTDTIELKEPGNYTIYFEYRSVVNGKVYDTSNINGLVCKLRDTETGEYVKLENSSSNSTYTVNGREGQSLFSFSINKAGIYEIDAVYESGEGEEAVLAIGKGFVLVLVRTILICFGIFFAAIGGSIVLFVYTFRKRNKAKKVYNFNVGY